MLGLQEAANTVINNGQVICLRIQEARALDALLTAMGVNYISTTKLIRGQIVYGFTKA